VEDTADILMNFAVEGQPVPISLHEDYLQRPPRRTCEVIGDQGKILVNLAALSVEVIDGEGKQVEASSYSGFQRNQMFLDELNHFLKLTLPVGEAGVKKACPLVSVREAAYSLRMALAAKESLMTGKVVNLSR
jgi:predicted dehydrogenase